jgi:hypothetical protein
MVQLKKTFLLKKELKLLDVFAIATGTTLSGGFFLLPGAGSRSRISLSIYFICNSFNSCNVQYN